MKGLAFIDLDKVIADDSEREREAEARAAKFINSLHLSFEEEREKLYKPIFYSSACLYDPGLIMRDTVIPGAKEKIDELDARLSRVIIITSRPDYLRTVTMQWISSNGLLSRYPAKPDPQYIPGYIPTHEVMLKDRVYTFNKSAEWKAGQIASLAAMWRVQEIIVVDNEQKNLDEVRRRMKHVLLYTSLADVPIE